MIFGRSRRFIRTPKNAIEAIRITKSYQRDAPLALDSLDLTIRRGSVFGLLGPNGAGKSTFINIMAGLVVKTSGTMQVWGINIDRDHRQARACIGVVPQELNLDPFFTPRQLLDLHAGLYAIPRRERRTEELLDMVGLGDKGDSYARTLSGGMRRRLMIAKAMVHSPPILVLDEPTAGVDITLRHGLWDHIRTLNRQGVTIVLTTHYLEEAEQLCDQVAIIDHGRLVACESTQKLLSRVEQKELVVTVDCDLKKTDLVVDKAWEVRSLSARQLSFSYQPGSVRIDDMLSRLADKGIGVVDVTTRQADLEDVFIKLTSTA